MPLDDAATTPRVELRLLGPPCLLVDGVSVTFDTRKAMAILARLAVDGRQRRDGLVDWLWPESEPGRARSALRRTLSTLRTSVPDGVLSETGDTIELDRDRIVCDLDPLAELAAPLSSDVDVAHLRDLVRRVEGDFMEAFTLRDAPAFDTWMEVMRDRQRRDRLRLLGRLATAQAAAGQLDAAITTAEHRLALDPLQEQTHRQLMTLHTWRGDRGAVTEAYLACVRTLDEELGVAPLAETDQLYRAVLAGHSPPRPDPTPPVAGPDAGTTPPGDLPFVGRGALRARLLRRLGRALQHGGGVVEIRGGAGVGKTRLLDEVAGLAAARGATHVIMVRCEPAETALAYAPVVALLRGLDADNQTLPDAIAAEVARLLPGFGEPPTTALESTAARTRFVDALCTAVLTLATANDLGPGLVIVDDTHRADPETTAFLQHLAGRIPEHAVLLVLSARPDPVHTMQGPPVERIELEPLDIEAVRHLVDQMDADVDPEILWRETRGVPLRIASRLALGDAAGHVDDVLLVRRRIAACGDVAQQVLVAAAVIGQPASERLVRGASGRADDEVVAALDELVAAQLLVETVDEPLLYGLAHEQLLEVVLADATRTRRRLLHGRVADALMRGDPPAPAAVLARHLREAGREAEAAAAHAVAGQAAFDLYANLDAVDHLQAAIALGHTDAADLLLVLADAEVRLGRYREAGVNLTRARSRVGSTHARAHVDHRLGALRLREGDAAIARVHLDSAANEGLDDDDAARVHADLALCLLDLDDPAGAAAEAEQARELASAGVSRINQAWASNVAGLVARRRGDLDHARACLADALALADGELEVRIAALNNLALVHLAESEPEAAISTAREALELGRQLGDRHREAALGNNLADILHAAGDTAGALHLQTQVAEQFASIGSGEGDLAPGVWRLVDW